MRSIHLNNPAISSLTSHIKVLSEKLYEQIKDDRRPEVLSGSTDLFRDAKCTGQLLYIVDGSIIWGTGASDVIAYDAGDFFGILERVGIYTGKARTDFAISAVRYTSQEISEKIHAHPEMLAAWEQYICSHHALMSWFTASRSKVISPKVKSYKKGETIITQGSTGTDVFTLLEDGYADVMVDGVRVGDIGQNEMFGVFSALTGTPRTASVVAREPSLAVAVTQEEFLGYITDKPDLALKTMTEMANTIVELNQKVVSAKLRMR